MSFSFKGETPPYQGGGNVMKKLKRRKDRGKRSYKKFKKKVVEDIILKNSIFLTENNKINYIYKTSLTGKVIEVTNVSLEIYFKKKWVTILRYDNYHGYMHRHVSVSISDNSDTATVLNVRQKGTNRRLLRWAIDDIKERYLIYKTKFLERSGYSKLDIIDNLI